MDYICMDLIWRYLTPQSRVLVSLSIPVPHSLRHKRWYSTDIIDAILDDDMIRFKYISTQQLLSQSELLYDIILYNATTILKHIDVSTYNSVNSRGMLPIMAAIYNYNIDVIIDLIHKGASITIKYGCTCPLITMINIIDESDVINVLSCVDVTQIDTVRWCDGASLVHFVIECKKYMILEYLLSKYVHVNEMLNNDVNTPWHTAFVNNDSRAVNLMLQYSLVPDKISLQYLVRNNMRHMLNIIHKHDVELHDDLLIHVTSVDMLLYLLSLGLDLYYRLPFTNKTVLQHLTDFYNISHHIDKTVYTEIIELCHSELIQRR